MRYFQPELRLAVMLPTQQTFADKLGGLPWGLPANRWPTCAQCGQPQSLLAQLGHHPQRLDLGGAGRALHVFQCADWANTGCDPFEWGAGASACFVLEPGDLGAGLTPPPGSIGEAGNPWAWHGHVAARVQGWAEKADTVPADQHDAYFHVERWYMVPDEVHDSVDPGMKLGGIPHWGKVGPADHQPSPWRLAVQMPDTSSFPLRMPRGLRRQADESGQLLAKFVLPWSGQDRQGFDCRWANFATGIGYVYLNEQTDPPACYFTWQRLI